MDDALLLSSPPDAGTICRSRIQNCHLYLLTSFAQEYRQNHAEKYCVDLSWGAPHLWSQCIIQYSLIWQELHTKSYKHLHATMHSLAKEAFCHLLPILRWVTHVTPVTFGGFQKQMFDGHAGLSLQADDGGLGAVRRTSPNQRASKGTALPGYARISQAILQV